MEKIKSYILSGVVSSVDSEAFSLCKKSHFGEIQNNKVQYSLTEAMFLLEKEKMEIFSGKKKLSQSEFLEKCRKFDKKIQIKYLVFKDLRERGYIVKTALKFGADFRVYDKGSAPGEEHARWVVFCEHELNRMTWHEFSAKNRVAHSTKKNLLLAIVDEEGDISYYEVRWIKP